MNMATKCNPPMPKSAGERAMLKHIQECGAELLHMLRSCPDGLVRPDNELLPCLDFSNGMIQPMAARFPPYAVRFEYQGTTWRLDKRRKRLGL